jgi:PAS domain S-box-containing protein
MNGPRLDLDHHAGPARDLAPSLIESARDAIIALSPDGVVTSWNQGATSLYGYSSVEMIGRSIAPIVPPAQLAAELQLHARVRSGENLDEIETCRAARDGRPLIVSLRISPVRDAEGASLGTSEVARDVSERRQQDCRLIEEGETRLSQSFKEISDLKSALDEHAIVAVTDPQGRITYVNDKFCAISKYSREELIGRDHRIINSGYHPKEFIRDIWSTITQGKVWRGEIRNRAKDGSYYWVATTIVPFLNDQGKPRQYVAIRAEITERKLAEEALRERTEALARSNRDLEQFAYVASHDLQEPLRAVAGCVQILQRRYQDQIDVRGNELINHAVEGANPMRRLIDDLLAFSRVGTRGAAFQPVSCQEALMAAHENLSVSIDESGARITHDRLPTVRADPTQLTLLFQNLIANAIKFRREIPPLIHVSAAREAAAWRLSVRDNGIGIEAQFFDRIFGIFQRLHTRREYPGTGIGLAICKRIIEHHGGHISIESVPGEGSTFLFTLPD